MRTSSVLLSAASVLLAGASFPQPSGWPQVTVASHATEALGPGVSYDRWALATPAGPLVVHVTTVSLGDPHVALAVAMHHDAVTGTDEALSSIADRAHAEAAINADYFDINGSGAPLNVVAIGGRFLHQPDGAAAFVVGQDGGVSIGPVTLRATLTDSMGETLQANAVNDWGANDGLSLVTPEFGIDGSADVEVVLAPNGPTSYRVAAVDAGPAHLVPLTPGEFGLVARGAEQVGRLMPFRPGDVVTLEFESTPASIASAVGGGPLLLRHGGVVDDPAAPAPEESAVRYPVTGAGVSSDGSTLWLIVVDGRAPATSAGITRPMLAALLAAFGASDAMAFDSGGSTEMAIRHLGDASTSVANVPSDGRERSIADALLVLNTATPGPIAQALVRSGGGVTAVLAGSTVRFTAAAVDAEMQPVAVAPGLVGFSGDAPAVASIDASGLLSALSPGRVDVTARVGTVPSTPVPIDVVASPDALSISGYERVVEAGSIARLSVVATLNDGRSVAVDAGAVRWAAIGDGRIGADGRFTGGSAAGIATVTARVGAAVATLPLLVGEHEAMLAPLTDPTSAASWRFASSPKTVGGAVDMSAAPDGTSGLHLSYDFTQGGATRAAYAETTLPVGGEPLAFVVDVYGDGDGEWLRAGYRNADGIVDTMTIARHVDWRGWKTIRIDASRTARWPIVWTRLYAVEPRSAAIEAGDLWFRSLRAVYAGPSSRPAQQPTPVASP